MATKRAIFLGIRLLIAFAILYYLLTKIPFSNVTASLASAKLIYIVTASIIIFIMHLILGYRLRFFSKNQELAISTFKAVEINMTTVFYGLFLPGGNLTGGAIRFYKLSGRGKRMAQALAAITLDRIIATLALCAVGILFWLFHFPSGSEFIVFSMTFLLVGLALLNVFLFTDKTQSHGGFKRTLFSLIDRVLILFKLKNFVETFYRFRVITLKSIILILTLSIASQLLGVLVFYQLALSLGIDISFVAMGWVRCAVILITMIPISVAGLGVREGSLIFLLKPYGVQDDQTFALSILVFALTVLMIGLLGGLIEGVKLLQPKQVQN